MSSITTINSGDLITNSRTDINSNFSALNTDKIETSTLDTDTTLAANSDSKIATQKAVKAYVDSGGNPNASTTDRGIVQEATSAQVAAGTATGSTGARLYVNPSALASSGIIKFGGTGADGALTITSGATNINCSNAAVVIKNYTSISITGTGSLTFTNPHTNGTIIVLKSQGDVTITSSTSPAINAVGMGASGGADSSPGSDGGGFYYPFGGRNSTNVGYDGGGGGGGYGGGNGTAGTGTNAGAGGVGIYIHSQTIMPGKSFLAGTGGGGGGGGAEGSFKGAGGGGGGGGIVVLYNSLTTNSGTYTVAGGAGGASGNGSSNSNGANGGGFLYIECGGAYNCTSTLSAAGAVGNRGNSANSKSGGAGGNGYSLVALNTEFV